jgi:hypothetical protein
MPDSNSSRLLESGSRTSRLPLPSPDDQPDKTTQPRRRDGKFSRKGAKVKTRLVGARLLINPTCSQGRQAMIQYHGSARLSAQSQNLARGTVCPANSFGNSSVASPIFLICLCAFASLREIFPSLGLRVLRVLCVFVVNSLSPGLVRIGRRWKAGSRS